MEAEVNKEVKHTPLPWRICKTANESGFNDECVTAISGDGRDEFAGVFTSLKEPGDQPTPSVEGWANLEFIIEACNNYYSLKTDCDSYKESCDNMRGRIETLEKDLDYYQRVSEDSYRRIEELEKQLESKTILTEQYSEAYKSVLESNKGLLEALKETLQMCEQTLTYREMNGLTMGNVFLSSAIETAKSEIQKAESLQSDKEKTNQ